jgi:DNA-directed RNA polymerase specialized sigma24 family protein
MSIRIVRGQTPQQQADALARANLKRLESVVVNAVQGKLQARKMWLDKSDLEAAYNLGWHGVCQYIAQGEEVSNLTGFLIDITYKRAFDIYRQRHEGQHADADLATRSANGDVVDQVDDQLKIQELIARMKRRLNENERKAVTLCLLHGFRRREAADMLGIEQASFQRIMDSATKKLGGIVAEIDARGCGEDEWSRLLRSYALGLLSETDRDYARAVKHVKECEACDRYVMGLKGLAAVLPPVGLPFMPMLGHEKAILAHLYRMFGGGHGGASGAAAAQTAGGTAGATTGGGSLVGSISVGAAAKGAAVVAIAVVAISIRSSHDATKHHPSPPRTATVRAAPAVAAPTLASKPALAYSPRALPQATHKVARRSRRKGGDGPQRRSTYVARHITAAVPKAASSAESAVQKEFEIEPTTRGASATSQDQSARAAANQNSGTSAQSAQSAEREFGPEQR